MKISIITVCYNSEKTISQTFNSILNQDYLEVEYIVIDGGSTDSTLEIIQEYEQKFKDKNFLFKHISEKDNGIYDAMNKGIKLASGDVIGIINSDDWYVENILTEIVIELKKDSKIEILYGKMNVLNNKGEFKFIQSPGKLSNILETMVIPHPTVFVKKQRYEKFNFNIKNKIASDYEFLLDNYLNNTNFKEIDLIVANFRMGGESSTHELLGYKEVLNIQKRKKIKGIKKYINYYKKVIRAKIIKIIKKGEKLK